MKKITTYKLTAEQKYMYDYQQTSPDSTMYNVFPYCARLHDWADTEKFANAITDLLKIYPALSSVIADGNSQRYVPGLLGNIRVEHMSEDDFMMLKDNLIQPFDLDGGGLCRFKVIETERAKYFFTDNHHIICDGYSEALLFHAFNKLYFGKKIYPDSWLKYLAGREARAGSNDELRKWYEARYRQNDYTCYLWTDFPEGRYTNTHALLKQKLNIDISNINVPKDIFFFAAAIISIASYNNNPDVMLTWTDNGRHSLEDLHTIGLLLRDLPIAVHLEGMTTGELYGSIKEQMTSCLERVNYPYTLNLDDELACVMYQGKMYEARKAVKVFAEEVPVRWNKPASQNILDVEICEPDGEFELVLDYAAHRYKYESMKRFADIFAGISHELLNADMNTSAYNLLKVLEG